MVGRYAARFSALLAIVATAVGTYLIVTHHVHHSSTTTTAHSQPAHPRGKYAHAGYYTVQRGDSLTSIAGKTGLPVGTLEQLNPSLHPNSLQAGQRIRLQR